MNQTLLNEEASDTLVHLADDVAGALRYLPGESIDKEHVERWAGDLQKIMDGRVVRATRIRTRPAA